MEWIMMRKDETKSILLNREFPSWFKDELKIWSWLSGAETARIVFVKIATLKRTLHRIRGMNVEGVSLDEIILSFLCDLFFFAPSIIKAKRRETKMERWSIIFKSIRWKTIAREIKFKMEHEIITATCRMGSMLPIVNKASEVGFLLRDVYLL